jgi:hypothetical protein
MTESNAANTYVYPTIEALVEEYFCELDADKIVAELKDGRNVVFVEEIKLVKSGVTDNDHIDSEWDFYGDVNHQGTEYVVYSPT